MNFKYRIVIYDAQPHDRGLLALALRSAEPALEILDAETPLEIAHHVSSGAVDALIADPAQTFTEIAGLASELRKRSPQSLFWLFTAVPDTPTALECVGLGVDGRTLKESAGYLALPHALIERLRAQRELRTRFPLQEDAVFSGTFDLPACLLGKAGELCAVNRAFESLLERPRYELLALGISDLLRDPEVGDHWRQRLAAGAARLEAALPLATGSGSALTAACTAKALPEVPGQPGLWAMCLLDITRLQPGAVLAPAPAASEVDLDQILYAVSHDLQAPLNSLTSHARALAEAGTGEDTEAREAVREIGTLAARMQLMLDGIFQVANVRRATGEPERVSLDAVVQDALDNLRSEIEATAATIERDALPTLRVNRQQMVQVLQNLLANALKFRGDAIPRVRIHAEGVGGEALRIVVEDNGIGIEAGNSERIFGMFQRLHTDREYPGIGVGLAISRQIVRAHGGDITVDSAPGRGSRFVIEFKAAALRALDPIGPAAAD